MIRATLALVMEYEDEDDIGDPKEMLLEILAETGDDVLMDHITVERIEVF